MCSITSGEHLGCLWLGSARKPLGTHTRRPSRGSVFISPGQMLRAPTSSVRKTPPDCLLIFRLSKLGKLLKSCVCGFGQGVSYISLGVGKDGQVAEMDLLLEMGRAYPTELTGRAVQASLSDHLCWAGQGFQRRVTDGLKPGCWDCSSTLVTSGITGWGKRGAWGRFCLTE